jgi:histidinol dehydrogenase
MMQLGMTNWHTATDGERLSILERPAQRDSDSVASGVQDIIREVRERGDDAIHELTERFDGVRLTDFGVTAREFDEARALLTTAQVGAIGTAIDNVRRFHEAQAPTPIAVETTPGVRCERISHPIDSVGLYVPAGTAPLPSTVVMLAVPAGIAGCPVRVLCTPPRPDGTADPAVLVAAQMAGIDAVFKIGGAQAIAAMAFGTTTVPKVEKLFGPGNAWVTEAKSQVSADVGGAAIDMPAGPSEVLVIADDAADPRFVAADLLSQAEHGTDSQVLLVTTSERLAAAVCEAIENQLCELRRADIAAASLANSRIVVVRDIDTAVEVSNRYAPEHLILQIVEPRSVLPAIRNAGSVFVGPWSPESVGDYCSGTNHVLPTYGYARSYSGLGVDQFMRQMTIQELTRDGLASISRAVMELAALEGLDAHAAAVSCRLEGEKR